MANTQPGPHHGRGEPVSRSLLVDHFTPELADASAELLRSGASHFFSVRPVGGAIAEVAEDATAYPYRSANFSIAVLGSDPTAMDAAVDRLRPFAHGSYLSFDSSDRPERIEDAWTPEALARLRALKEEVDPTNRFRDNFSVAGDQSVRVEAAAA
jgi:FAD/FMN-containing dehydrogenase